MKEKKYTEEFKNSIRKRLLKKESISHLAKELGISKKY